MKKIQVFEREKIFYGSDKTLSEQHFNSLVQYNDQNDQKYFSVIHRGIKFNQYVGVIKVGSVVIEILPKLDYTSQDGESYNYWQDVLLGMLRECKILTPSAPTQAELKLRANSLLDLYFELFIGKMETLYHKGLIKRYVKREENKKAVKGKIQFGKHLRENYIHKERFYVSYKEYSHNHLINQILYKTLRVIDLITDDPTLKSRIAKLSFSLPDLDDIEVKKDHFDRISFDRKNEKYREVLQISELLLLNYSPDIKSGRNDVLALLFDMEQLFEEYVFRRLKKLSMHQDFEVQSQVSKKFWKSRSIRPDIVLKLKNETYVLDTKWKSLSTINPDISDLRQMFVYNQYFGSKHSFLVYPKAGDLQYAGGHFARPSELFRVDKQEVEHGCMLYFIPIVTEDGLNRDASTELIKNLTELKESPTSIY